MNMLFLQVFTNFHFHSLLLGVLIGCEMLLVSAVSRECPYLEISKPAKPSDLFVLKSSFYGRCDAQGQVARTMPTMAPFINPRGAFRAIGRYIPPWPFAQFQLQSLLLHQRLTVWWRFLVAGILIHCLLFSSSPMEFVRRADIFERIIFCPLDLVP